MSLYALIVKSIKHCIVLSYVLRVVCLMYSNVVESNMSKRLKVYIFIITYILYVYEIKCIAYEVL